MADNLALKYAEEFMPMFRVSDNGMMVTFNPETHRREVTAISIEMVRAHMEARMRKWMSECPRYVDLSSFLARKAFHVRITQIVGDDHLYQRRVMKEEFCPICAASTKIGLDVIC